MSGQAEPERRRESMKSPLLVLATCFALGIVVAQPGRAWCPGVPFLLASAGGCLLVALIALRAGWQRIPLLLALAGFVAAGAAAGRLFEVRFPPSHVSRLAELGVDLADPVRLEGRLVSTPLRTSYGLQFDVEVNRLESRGQARPLTGKVRLRLQTTDDPEMLTAADALRLQYGDGIRALVQLRRTRIYQNPGSFDFRRWMETIEDLYWVGTIKNPLLVEKLPGAGAPGLSLLLQKTRQRLLQGIDLLYPPWSADGRNGAVIKAVLLGEISSIDSETIENFRKTGLYHQLVVSGLQVGLLALLAGLFLRLLPLSELWRSALVLAFLLGYVLLLEQRAPTLRATVMIFVYLLARFFYREQAALNAIGLAALILLLHRPPWLFESGFELSFAAVLLIAGLAVPALEHTTEPYRRALQQLGNVERDIIFAPRLAQFRLDVRATIARIGKRVSLLGRRPAVAAATATWPLKILLWTINMLLFSAIIQLGLLLPMAETFHRVTFAGIGLNALATPLVTLLLGIALPTVLLAATLPVLAVLPAKALAVVTGALLMLTDLPGLPSWLSYRVPEPPAWVSWGFALALVSAAWALGRRQRTFWAALAAACIFGTLISLHPFAPRVPRGVLEVTALDCGGGDAIFLVLPDRTTMLVDAGGSRWRGGREGAFRGRRWDPGEDIVSPYLWSRGVKKIDVVALSHAHDDHLGGLTAVVKNFRIGEFWHGPNPPIPAYQALLEQVRLRGIPIRRVAAGDLIPRGATSIGVLWPPPAWPTSNLPSNDDSVVMRISHAEATVLLPGDISSRVEQALARSLIPLESKLLKVPHHGAKSASSPELLVRVSPRVALVSTESGSSGNLPDPEVLDRLEAVGARVFRTDLHGAITVAMKGSSLSIRTYRTSWGD